MSVEFVGIELELRGADAVYGDLQKIDGLLNSFRGKKKVDAGMNELRKQIVAARGELEKFQRRQKAINDGFKSGSINKNDFWAKQLEEASRGAENAKRHLKDLQQAQRIVQAGAKSMGDTFMQTFNRYSSMLAHVGGRMQSLGNALTKLTSPFERFTSGMIMGAGYKALGKFSEGLENGFNRYDTMKKYPKVMAAFGYSAKESKESIDALDQSVRGLPTGLDEMVDLTQRFTATTGDLQKGTKLAIATNNAFLASMSTDTQRYQGMMQLQDVLGGKDMNSREWNSLVSSMTPAIVKMGEAMKESGKWSGSIGDFIQHIRDGKMDNQEFVDQLIKIGNEGGVLEQMAQQSKDTWQAFFANIGNAASRMTAGVIEGFDEIVKAMDFKDKYGQPIESVNMLLSDRLIPSIDKATASIKEWIAAHPEEIRDFFTDLSKIDVKSFFKGMADGMKTVAGWLQWFSRIGQSEGFMKFMGRFMVFGNIAGKGLTVIGGIIRGLSHPLAGLLTILTRMGGGKLAGGLFGKLKGLFGSKKDMTDVADTATLARGAVNNLVKLAEGAGAVLIVGGTGFATFKFVKSMIQDLGEIITVADGIDWNKGAISLTAMVAGIGFATEAFNAIGGMLGKGGLLNVAIAGLASILVTGSIAADMRLIKDSLKSFAELPTLIQQGLDGFSNLKSVANVSDVKTKIKNAMTLFGQIKDLVSPKRMRKGEEVGGLDTLGSGTVQNIENYATTITQIKNIVSKLNQLSSIQIADMDVEGMMSDLHSKLESVYNNLKSLPNIGDTESQMTGLANAMIQVRRVIYHLNKIGELKVSTSGGTNIKKAVDSIKKAFTDSSVGALASQIRSFASSIRSALAELRNLGQEILIEASVKLSDGFNKSVNDVIKQINKAKDNIKKEGKKPVSFTIPVRVRFSVTTNARMAINAINDATARVKAAKSGYGNVYGPVQQESTGGMIYRAKGGDVPFFKRRGTDTVPAMLTPGEYVQNKKAVSMFGINFMRKVNNLDMKGAMHELMHRAGSMASVGRSTVVNNNYNNNQKVVINNNGNPSAGYTFKRASRFVGAI